MRTGDATCCSRPDPPTTPDAGHALSGPRRKRLYDTLRRDGRAGIQTLSTRLGLSREIVRRILEDFQEQGVTEREPGHHGKFFVREAENESRLHRGGRRGSDDPME